MQVKGDATLNKLIILFVFDKMEVPLSENTILDMCCSSNNWIAYMYAITPDGRVCLANFFVKIPASTREEISVFIKQNRLKYRRKQECVADYYMNKDGTYTVYLKIIEPVQPLLELKFVVPNRQTAKNIYKKWEEKAANVYSLIYDNLVD